MAMFLDLIREMCARKHRSLVNLRRGCLDLMGASVVHGTPKVGASSRAFARRVTEATGLSFAAIVSLLNQHSLG
jgi:hypothetical protein